MKKLLALLLALVMSLSLAACGGSGEETPSDTTDEGSGTEETAGIAAEDLQIGLICIHDENSGYDLAHIDGLRGACEALGIGEDQITMRINIPESQECYDAATQLADAGCDIIFSDSYGHQSYMALAAQDYPDVTFVACTGDQAAVAGIPNLKNIFPYTYESRYVSGVVAGVKLKEMMDNGEVTDPYIGYVGAYPYAEVVSGYTAFFLGIQSVYPDVVMEVSYTNSWFDITAEGTAAESLMADGCVIIGQHADSTGAPAAAQAAQDSGTVAYSVGYNIDMLSVAPTAALTSATNDWGVYYTYAFNCALNGEEISTDWCEGYETGAVGITELGESCAEGTADKVAEVEAALKSGELQVFDTSTFTVNGEHPTSILVDMDGDFEGDTEGVVDGVFMESSLRSAPGFTARIDGITELNN